MRYSCIDTNRRIVKYIGSLTPKYPKIQHAPTFVPSISLNICQFSGWNMKFTLHTEMPGTMSVNRYIPCSNTKPETSSFGRKSWHQLQRKSSMTIFSEENDDNFVKKKWGESLMTHFEGLSGQMNLFLWYSAPPTSTANQQPSPISVQIWYVNHF